MARSNGREARMVDDNLTVFRRPEVIADAQALLEKLDEKEQEEVMLLLGRRLATNPDLPSPLTRKARKVVVRKAFEHFRHWPDQRIADCVGALMFHLMITIRDRLNELRSR
jgi:hypothetical protein